MSDLTFNKVAGAVLATGLAIVGLRELSAGVFAPEHLEKPGYAVEVVEASTGGAAAEAPIDWGTVLPTADVAAGEAVFAKCKACHNADQGGANGVGPELWGVVGRKPAASPGFAYSPAMSEFAGKQPSWDYEHLSEFLKAPQKYISGTKMTFVGLKKPEERIAVIAYLHSRGSSLPIPAPNPAAAAAPAEATPATAEGAPATGAAPADQPTVVGATTPPAPNATNPAGGAASSPK